MASKGYILFKNRLVKFREDCELANAIVRNKELLRGEDHAFARTNEADYPLLSERANTPNSRKLIVSHLRKTVFVAFIKELYEEVTEYFKYILKEAANSGVDPNRLVGDIEINLKANDILAKGNKKEIAQMIAEKLFRKLEQRAKHSGTIELISTIRRKLGLEIDEQIISSALPYLETRHIYVHADGKADSDFIERYPNMTLDSKGRIELNPSFINEAYNEAHRLIQTFDSEMEGRNYFSASEIHLAPAE